MAAIGVALSQVLGPPALVPLNEIKAEVVNIRYATEVPGDNGILLKVNDADNYRIAVVTVRIDKPEAKRLLLAAADLTLHYWRGDEFEVAPCEGLSRFSVQADEERPITMFSPSGPGWVKQETSPGTTRAGTVYVDVVFGLIEKDITQAWLFVGQPGTAASTTPGW